MGKGITIIRHTNFLFIRYVELDLGGTNAKFICLQLPWWNITDCIFKGKSWRIG